jgi:primosomal protein N' (replication factor Y) (superfamily II helicase)
VSYVDVAVFAPIEQLLTYQVPLELKGQIQVGSRILVELGRRKVMGVVIKHHRQKPTSGFTIKPVEDVVDAQPIVPLELLHFLCELANYYFVPLGEVMRLAMPAIHKQDAKRLENHLVDKVHGVGGRQVFMVEPSDQVEETGTLRGNALAILTHLRTHGRVSLAQLSKQWSNARSVVQKLAGQDLVRYYKQEQSRDPFFREPVVADVPPTLTGAQKEATTAINLALEGEKSQSFLLFGVTGSGKTEVYLHVLATAQAQGKGAVVLVPEIALTPQLVGRFRARFGDNLAVLHSGLHERDRLAMWNDLRNARVSVAIGARSALFAPVPNLGLVIVDEEHDSSFKQEEGVRYHARDMALLRAHRAGAVCVLGSATPSMESEYLSRTGKLTKITLPQRAKQSSRLPDVQFVDLRRTGPGPSGNRRLTLPLHRKLEATLARKEQAIIFLNRRGFSPSLVCERCGVTSSCSMCAVALTFHRKSGLLRCHYCDYERQFDGRCAHCSSDKVSLEGLGTERVEDTLAACFPEARVARLDRDVASGNEAEAILEKLRNHEIDILVGTQMVAKGHDIPNVTLVGVLNADSALSMPDFRASERAFQLLVQVAGRAGRGESRGTVIFQTWDPARPALVHAQHHDVASFMEDELESRRELNYPPFTRLALIRVSSADQDRTREVANQLAEIAKKTESVLAKHVEVLGPAPAPITRLRAKYRFRILLKAKQRSHLRTTLQAIAHLLPKVDHRVRVVIDVDPVSML